MRNPSDLKKVQQLTKCLASLFHFLSCFSDKDFQFFATLKKKEKLEWVSKWKEAFSNLNGVPSVIVYLYIPDNKFAFIPLVACY